MRHLVCFLLFWGFRVKSCCFQIVFGWCGIAHQSVIPSSSQQLCSFTAYSPSFHLCQIVFCMLFSYSSIFVRTSNCDSLCPLQGGWHTPNNCHSLQIGLLSLEFLTLYSRQRLWQLIEFTEMETGGTLGGAVRNIVQFARSFYMLIHLPWWASKLIHRWCVDLVIHHRRP